MYLGDPQPKFTWSVSNNFKFGNFDLNIFIEGVQGSKIFNNTALLLDKSNFQQSKNTLRYLLDDKISLGYSPRVSNRYVEDGSYMRLSSVTLGYNFRFQNTSMIKSLRVYASGSNLFVITNYKGFDPDVTNGTRQDYNGINSFGIDITSYPKARTYSLGLNVTF
jgi:iron complex outermembrane receptor protein